MVRHGERCEHVDRRARRRLRLKLGGSGVALVDDGGEHTLPRAPQQPQCDLLGAHVALVEDAVPVALRREGKVAGVELPVAQPLLDDDGELPGGGEGILGQRRGRVDARSVHRRSIVVPLCRVHALRVRDEALGVAGLKAAGRSTVGAAREAARTPRQHERRHVVERTVIVDERLQSRRPLLADAELERPDARGRRQHRGRLRRVDGERREERSVRHGAVKGDEGSEHGRIGRQPHRRVEVCARKRANPACREDGCRVRAARHKVAAHNAAALAPGRVEPARAVHLPFAERRPRAEHDALSHAEPGRDHLEAARVVRRLHNV
mmetsp:Transcript_26451/g.84043  ORF Transcript_26451/g.84043 Transcript_26451/m.84043 type:complete len:322 (-) Transcript_26451:242-1207(-)